MRKILVTGGCGFIGSNLIRYWLKRYPKDKIINLDKLTYAGHLSSTKDFASKANYQFIKADICNIKIVSEVMKGIDWVVHMAAESHVDRSIIGPARFIKTNIVGTQVLLDAALQAKVSKFLYISTDEVFGELSLGSKERFTEKSLYQPHSPYSASKAAADHLVRAYHITYHLPTLIINCSNNYGPYQDPEKFIPRAITNVLEGQPIPIYGDGLYTRDWLYVKDHCRAIELVLKKGKVGETYCVGGMAKDVNNLTLARTILKIMGKGEKWIVFVKDRPGHDRRYAVDWSKIKNQLGWQPKYKFEKSLKLTVCWYQKNGWWWRPLKEKTERFYQKLDKKISK